MHSVVALMLTLPHIPMQLSSGKASLGVPERAQMLADLAALIGGQCLDLERLLAVIQSTRQALQHACEAVAVDGCSGDADSGREAAAAPEGHPSGLLISLCKVIQSQQESWRGHRMFMIGSDQDPRTLDQPGWDRVTEELGSLLGACNPLLGQLGPEAVEQLVAACGMPDARMSAIIAEVRVWAGLLFGACQGVGSKPMQMR